MHLSSSVVRLLSHYSLDLNLPRTPVYLPRVMASADLQLLITLAQRKRLMLS